MLDGIFSQLQVQSVKCRRLQSQCRTYWIMILFFPRHTQDEKTGDTWRGKYLK